MYYYGVVSTLGDDSTVDNLRKDPNLRDYSHGVTYFPAGVAGVNTATNPKSYKDTKAFNYQMEEK